MSTLKEKFNQNIITNIDIRDSENRMYYEYNHLEVAEQCEKIADDYAIEFLLFEQKAFSGKIMNYEYAKSMLETFKKEKGL